MKNAVQAQNGLRDAALSILLGTLCAVLVSILLLVIFSLLLVLKDMPAGVVQPFAFVAVAGGGFGGGLFAGRLFRQKGLVLGVVTGLVFLLVLFVSDAALGHFTFGGMVLFKLLAAVLAGAFGGIVGVNTLRRRSRI